MKKSLYKALCLFLILGLVFPVTSGCLSAGAAGSFFGFEEDFEVSTDLLGTSIAGVYNGWGLTISNNPPWADKKIVFYQDSDSDNISANFTAEKEHDTYTDSQRKNYLLKYDLSSVANSDYFEFAYSLKSTGEPHLFQVLVNGLHVGDVDFGNMKIGGKAYTGAADSNGWYNIKLVSSTKSGKTYVFVNEALHLETTTSWAGRAAILQIGLISSSCSGADVQLDNVKFNFLTEAEFLESAGIVTSATPTIFAIGDSTAADYITYSENEIAGWAQVLYNYMDDSNMVKDYAEPGASSKSFYNYKWPAVIKKVEKGDYVLIQFGHNDEKTGASSEDNGANVTDPNNRYTSPTESVDTEGSYKWYLKKYADEVSAKEAIPVFVTSIERRLKAIDKIANPEITSTLDAYVKAMKDLGADIGVPVIDLYTESVDLIADYEEEESGSSANLYMVSVDPASNDNTHLTQKGAMEIAKRFCKLLNASNDETLTAFKENMKDDLDNVVFVSRLFELTEDFENSSLIDTSIANGYNGWEVRVTSPSWDDKDIVFNEEANGNITAKFTADVADPSDANQINSNRKLRYFNYDLSSVANSDCFQMEYSLKSTGTPNKFQVIIGGKFIGNVDFNDMKIGEKVYNGPADSDGWYNIKMYINTKTGKTYWYVNNVFHNTSTESWAGRIGLIQFCLERTVCSGAEIQLDNILLKFITEEEFCDVTGEIPSTLLEPVKLVKSGNNITGLTVKAGYVPKEGNKLIIAIYSSKDSNGETVKDTLKGIRFVTVASVGENDITLDNPIAYENSDIINVYYWDMNTLTPNAEVYDKLS